MKKIVYPIVFFVCAGSLCAQTVVNGFGDSGWFSWDSRDASGTHLFGSNYTHSGWSDGGEPVAGDDAKIASQIKFLGEGQIVANAAGGMPAVSPSGSLGGAGYVRLDGTSSNSGKSDLSFVDTDGFASSLALLDIGFSTKYRYYSASRRVGLNIEFVGHDADGMERNYVFVFVQPDPFTADGWNEVTVNRDSLFYLYGGGGTPNGAQAKTFADWAADETWGSRVFVEGGDIFRFGFNIGSSQSNGLIYLDWAETSLLASQGTIDFQAIPEPGAIALVIGGVVFIVVIPLRRRLAAK